MPARRQLLQKITLNANVASVTFSNIPQTFTDLRLVISARTDRASDTDGASVRFNGDTGTNYSTRLLEGSGSAAQSRTFTSQTSLYVGQGVAGGSSTASTFGNAEAHIPNYTGSTQKAVLSRGTSENNATASWMSLDASLWTGTAAITSITLLPINGPNFLAGSTFYLYGITHVPIINGGEVSIHGGYKIHTFRNTSSLQVVEAGAVEYLVIAGGGGGGANDGGGGGAGGYRASVSGEISGGGAVAEPRLILTPATYTVTVGAGGAGGGTSGLGINGSNSSLSNITSIGGAGGAYGGLAGTSGGSGSGGSSQGSRAGGAGTAGQGYSGGAGVAGVSSGGGGGAGEAGNTDGGASGGDGVISSITGSSVQRGGGGSGGGPSQSAGDGGGGGPSSNAVANTGGGGGSWSGTGTAGAGGSGIVIIRYPYDGN